MPLSSPPFWQSILNEKDRLEEQARSFQLHLFEAESRLHDLERELKDARAELKLQLLRRHFPAAK